jgi:hypothetical protein
MSSATGSFDPLASLAARGIDLPALGSAYLLLLATAALTIAAFFAARKLLVISPNRGSRDYGIYVSLALAALSIAIVLENESLPAGSATLHYVVMPQLLTLMGLHLWIWYRQEPWVVALGAAATTATIVVGVVLGIRTELLGPAYSITLLVLAALLGFLWRRAVSTQRGFINASSIYIGSKETLDAAAAPQKPWLGLPQWTALLAASLGLGFANSLLRGRGLEEIPALEVAAESGLLLVVTALVCAVPAISYWVTRKAWMPELTRFVWLAWLVVGFALTYGNYLSSLARA